MNERERSRMDEWTGRLSEHVDGELSAVDASALEQHLASCDDCRGTLTGLRAVRDRARSLVDPPAPDDLWAGIATRIGSAGSTRGAGTRVLEWPRRNGFAPVPALAAAAALVLVSATALWATRGARERDASLAVSRAPAAPTTLASFDAVRFEGEIAQLQQALERGRGKLDPETVKVLERNLTVIRQATEDARKALLKDPANRDLQDYFAATMQNKLDLLRRSSKLAGV